MDVLRGNGYQVESQLGVARFRIEAGVRHLTNRTVSFTAMEFEGPADHSGVSVRDRHRIGREVLEHLGSRDRIWRIWSTDWFRSPAAQTERLLQFLESPKTLHVLKPFRPRGATGATTAACRSADAGPSADTGRQAGAARAGRTTRRLGLRR